MNEFECQLWLAYIDDLWNDKRIKLIERFGCATEIFREKEENLRKTGILTEENIYNISNSKKSFDFDKTQNILYKKGIRFTYFGDSIYPVRLYQIAQPPTSLFFKGKLPSNEISFGIVGARNCTDYGKMVAHDVAYQLATYNVDVISGMARGIDSCAHVGAIDADGRTFAVLGCGVDICYPRENIELYDNITKYGGIISEYKPGSKPEAWHFPARNRIIAGLSDSLMVVEAKEKSGSFITVDFALDMGKNVYALPGRIIDPLSVGCNNLIEEGARPYISTKRLIEDLKIESGKTTYNNENNEFNKKIKNISLEKEEALLYSCLDLLPKSQYDLEQKTGLDITEIQEKLMNLQLLGLAKEVSKGCYTKNI